MRKLLGRIKAFLLYGMVETTKPTEQTPRSYQKRMSQSSIALIHALVSSPEYLDALREFTESESNVLIERERQFVRSGSPADLQAAALMEGGAIMLEDLVGLLKGVAAQYQPPKS